MATDPISQLIESGIGGLAALGSSWISSESDQKINAENLAYQREYNQQIFSREDNAVQRRVADLKAAGLSPILAAGSGAGAGGTTTAPQKQQERTLDPGAAMMMAIQHAQTMAQMELIKKQALEAEKGADLKEAETLKTQEEAAGIAIDNTIKGNYGQEDAWAKIQNLKAQGNLSAGTLMDLLYNYRFYNTRGLPTSGAGFIGSKAMEEAGSESYNRNWYANKGLPTNASGLPKELAEAAGMTEAAAKKALEIAAAETAKEINEGNPEPKVQMEKKGFIRYLWDKAKSMLDKSRPSRENDGTNYFGGKVRPD